MDTQLTFITKVILLSLVIALLIKYVCPFLHIPAMGLIAIFSVFMPTVIMAIILIWRGNKQANIH